MNVFAYVAAGSICVAGCNSVSDVTTAAKQVRKRHHAPFVRQRAWPPQAVVGPQRTVLPGQQICLTDDLSYHPLGIPYITSWTQVAGEPVNLNANDCFAAPAAGWTLAFTLTADDAAMRTHDTLLLHVVTSSAALGLLKREN